MANILTDEKREQVIALGRLGWSLRRIEKETGVRRETAGAYLKAAGMEVRRPGSLGCKPKPATQVTTDPAAAEVSISEAKPATANQVTTDSAAGEAKAPVSQIVLTDRALSEPSTGHRKSHCLPFHEFISDALARGRNGVGIYQNLVDDYGFAHSYQSVKRYVRLLRGAYSPEAHPVIETAPGEEGQVDYGDGPMVRHPETGTYRRTRLFAFVLGFSRKAVRILTWKSSSEIWARLHEQAFRRLGGAPRTTVLDNLKEGVLTPDVYDPALNPLYRDVLKHYGVVALPCRVFHPDRKGKVESGIGHTQRTPLAGMRFDFIEQGQNYLDTWETKWADTRIHGTTKRQVAAMFEEEKPHLLPLPLEPFRYYRFGVRTVHLDGCVEVDGAYYMAPPGHIGRTLQVQWDELYVRLIESSPCQKCMAKGVGPLLREHLKQAKGRYRYQPEDRPAKTPSSTLELLARAQRAGKYIGALTAEIHQREPVGGVRRILGVLSLARRFGPAVVDDACAMAVAAGVPTYRFVRQYLERRPNPALTLRQVDPLIRELTHYRDLINRLTQTGENE